MLSSLYDTNQSSKRRGKQEQRKSTQPKANAEYRAEQRAAKEKKQQIDKKQQLQAAALHSKNHISKGTSNEGLSSTSATIDEQPAAKPVNKSLIQQTPNV